MTLDELLERLGEVSGVTEAYLVGGCVRDGLMGRPFYDLDIAVSGAEEFARRLGGTLVPLGERFGTWRVVMSPWTVDVSEMQGDIFADLGRRDVTVNAMAIALPRDTTHGSTGPPRAGWVPPGPPTLHVGSLAAPPSELLDPFGGLADLRAGTVRMVRAQNLSDDPLRLLRAVRLAAELGFSIEPGTELAIAERADLITGPAPERQREELCRILAADGAAGSLALLDRLGLLAALLPDLVMGKGVEQPKEHYWDVFEHQIQTVAAVEAVLDGKVARPWTNTLDGYFEQHLGNLGRQTLLKLTALLHDVGKPATKSVQANGRVRFFGHSELGAEMVERAMVRLRFSDQQTRMATTMVTHHLRPGQWSDGGLPTNRALYRYFRDLGDVAIDTIFLNLADHLAARGPMMDREDWAEHVAVAEYALDKYFDHEEKTRQERLVTGHDLMQAFGLAPGPLVGRLLAEVDEAWRTGAISGKDEALALLRGRLVP